MRMRLYITLVAIFLCSLPWMNLDFVLRKFIFRPEKLDATYTFEFKETFEEVFVESPDGAKLNGIWFPAKEAKFTILYFHGNRDNLVRWGEIAAKHTKYHANVLVMDYRTYGKSKGKITEKLLNQDAILWYEKAQELGRDLPIIAFGRSLGTGLASKIASEKEVRGLILETPYTSMVDVIDHYAPKWVAKKSDIAFSLPQELKEKELPIIIFHGTKDEVIPFEIGSQVNKNLEGRNTKFVIVEGGRHNDLSNYPLYWDEMEAWIKSL